MANIHFDSDNLVNFEDNFSSAVSYLKEAKRIANSFVVPNYYFDYFAHSSYLSGLGSKIDSECRVSETVSDWAKGSKLSYGTYSEESVAKFDAIPDAEIKPRTTIVVVK